MINALALVTLHAATAIQNQSHQMSNLSAITHQVEHFYYVGWESLLTLTALTVTLIGVIFGVAAPLWINRRAERKMKKLIRKLSDGAEERLGKQIKESKEEGQRRMNEQKLELREENAGRIKEAVETMNKQTNDKFETLSTNLKRDGHITNAKICNALAYTFGKIIERNPQARHILTQAVQMNLQAIAEFACGEDKNGGDRTLEALKDRAEELGASEAEICADVADALIVDYPAAATQLNQAKKLLDVRTESGNQDSGKTV